MGKSADLHARGFQNFLTGQFKPYSGIPPEAKQQLLVALRFRIQTEQHIMRHFVDPIREIAASSRAMLAMYGVEFRLHCTVKSAFPSPTQSLLSEEEWMNVGCEMQKLFFPFRNESQTFSNLVIDPGGNGLLTEDVPAPWLCELRKRIEEKIESHMPGYTPSPIDWAHCTLWRTRRAPAHRDRFVEFFKLYNDLPEKTPILVANFESLYAGPAADFFE